MDKVDYHTWENHQKTILEYKLIPRFLESEFWKHIIQRKTRLFYDFLFSFKFFAAKLWECSYTFVVFRREYHKN